MPMPPIEITPLLLDRIAQVRRRLGLDETPAVSADSRFADLLDSMGMVEFLCLVADDCGVTPGNIEKCVAHRFGTVAELATAMTRAGYRMRSSAETS